VDTAIAREVNVYHLLTHTSGIADDAEEENGEEYADLFRTNPNYAVTETADFLPQFASKPPNSRPARDAATVTAAISCWVCSSRRSAVCPIGTMCVGMSLNPPECFTPTFPDGHGL
jgi:hypothetical protein